MASAAGSCVKDGFLMNVQFLGKQTGHFSR
jgi:hypothetical protein